VWILKDDTLIDSDSESNHAIDGPPDAPDDAGTALRSSGRNGIRVGSAKDGSLKSLKEALLRAWQPMSSGTSSVD
jgi:hypothetical protein